MTTSAARWPLHPVPGPIESLSSWLDRIAAAHGMGVQDLVANLDLGEAQVPANLDHNPCCWPCSAVKACTGTGGC